MTDDFKKHDTDFSQCACDDVYISTDHHTQKKTIFCCDCGDDLGDIYTFYDSDD